MKRQEAKRQPPGDLGRARVVAGDGIGAEGDGDVDAPLFAVDNPFWFQDPNAVELARFRDDPLHALPRAEAGRVLVLLKDPGGSSSTPSGSSRSAGSRARARRPRADTAAEAVCDLRKGRARCSSPSSWSVFRDATRASRAAGTPCLRCWRRARAGRKGRDRSRAGGAARRARARARLLLPVLGGLPGAAAQRVAEYYGADGYGADRDLASLTSSFKTATARRARLAAASMYAGREPRCRSTRSGKRARRGDEARVCSCRGCE